MKNKLALSLLTLAVLTACSGNNNQSNDAAADNPAEVTAPQAVSQEQIFIKIQARQVANSQAVKKFAEETYSKVTNEAKAKEAQAKVKAKVDQLNTELQEFYQGLSITDTDLKDYIKLNEDALKIQQDLDLEIAKLQRQTTEKKKQLSPDDTKTYQELRTKLMRITLDLLNKKNSLDQKFAVSATDLPVKEFYQVSNILNLKNKKIQAISADSTVKSPDAYNKRLVALLPQVDADSVKALKALKITDADVKAYADQSVKVLQNEIELIKRAPQMQKEMNDNKKLSPANEKFEQESDELNSAAEEKLAEVLSKLANK